MNIEDTLRRASAKNALDAVRILKNDENRMILQLELAGGLKLDFIAVEDKLIPRNHPQVVGAHGIDSFASMEKRA